MLVAGATPIGLAFDAFDGQLATASALESAAAGDNTGRRHATPHASALTRGLVHAGDAIRPLIDVAAVLAAVGSRPASAPRSKER